MFFKSKEVTYKVTSYNCMIKPYNIITAILIIVHLKIKNINLEKTMQFNIKIKKRNKKRNKNSFRTV